MPAKSQKYNVAAKRLDVSRLIAEHFGSVSGMRDQIQLTHPDAVVPEADTVQKWVRRHSVPTAQLVILSEIADAAGKPINLADYTL